MTRHATKSLELPCWIDGREYVIHADVSATKRTFEISRVHFGGRFADSECHISADIDGFTLFAGETEEKSHFLRGKARAILREYLDNNAQNIFEFNN